MRQPQLKVDETYTITQKDRSQAKQNGRRDMYSSPGDLWAIERAVWGATNVPWYPRRASMTTMADTKWAGLTLRLLVSQSTDHRQGGPNGSRRASESLRFVVRRSRVFTKIGLVEPIGG